MKRLLVCCMLMVAIHHISAQTPWLWPIEGAKAGDNILYSPQELVDNELNSENLIVAAPEGVAVVAPFDGIFEGCSITYSQTFEMQIGWRMSDDSQSIDEKKAEIISSGNFDRSYNPKYLTGSVTLRTADSKSVTIVGLSSDHKFKPGQRIARGTPIGYVAYSYFKIPEPAIMIEVSNGGLKSDPMKPFGLASTYKPYTAPKPVVSLTREQAADDFMIYIDALKECFPGLYDVISPEELDGYVRTTLARINSRKGTIPYAEFRAMMEETVAKAHDSHIHVYPPEWRVAGGGKSYRPGIWFGFFSDTLRVSNATEQFRHLIGRQIASVNGIGADSIRQIMTSKIATYDAHTEGFKQYMSAIPSGMIRNFREPYTNARRDMKVLFTDGNEVEVPGMERIGWISDHTKFMTINNDYPGNFQTKMLNDRTAYIGLKSFWINQVEMETIAAFIDSIATVPNLVIDVRNNLGGDGRVLYKLYSYIAGQPMTLHGFSKVVSNTRYESFKYSTNYPPDTEMFTDYVPEQGHDGFFRRSGTGSVVRADSLVNYKGRVYMLTNAKSVSAATLLPALLVRNHRGVTVGRETASAYHFMNAVKFVDVQLPASRIKIRLPLVQTHFDSVVNERVPYGRGVMPDYPVVLSLEEMMSNRDVMLDYTLGLIERGEYLRDENPFDVGGAGSGTSGVGGDGASLPVMAVISAAIVTAVAVVSVRRKTRIFARSRSRQPTG